MNQQAGAAPATEPASKPATSAPESLLRRHWRGLLGVAVLAMLVYVAGVEVLARLLVHFSAGAADANTRLNAVTSTRGALLGMLTPLVVALGGIAAFLNYQEVSGQNRRLNERAGEERDETRRLRRARVYANFIDGSERCASAALVAFFTPSDHADYKEALRKVVEGRRAFSAAHDQLMLLGADEVQDAAHDLYSHSATLVKMAMSSPKATEDAWKGVYATDYSKLYLAFRNAARKDLEATR